MQGTVAGVGDLVQARRNAWHLDGLARQCRGPDQPPVYRVIALHPDRGGLTVARVTGRGPDGVETLAEPLQLPARYVNEHVTLAYASTVHAAHGRTVQDGIGVLGPGTDAESGYVQATRGTDTNMVFAVTRNIGDSADTGETFKIAARTATEVVSDVIRPPDEDRNRTALAEAEAAADRARSTAAHIDPLLTVLDDTLAGRTGRWLDELAATGALPEQYRVDFAVDDARESVDQLLRSAELAGHDARQILTSAVTSTSLKGSTSVAQVLHFRIRSALDNKLTPNVTSYRDLLPADLPPRTRDALLTLADAADTRRAGLGATLAFAPPPWATDALGPVPDDGDERALWEAKAGWAASYRELVQHDDAEDALGVAPPRGLAEKHALFHTAHAALDLATAGAEEEAMSEGRLRARIAAWEREKEWAPDYVAERLEATQSALRAARENLTIWAARADVETDPLEADQFRGAAEQMRERVAEMEKQIEDLRFADDARAAWRFETAVTKDNAERARHAAAVRGIDLDNPAEQITAEEWLDEHRAAQLIEDEHREISEHDVTDDDAREERANVTPAGLDPGAAEAEARVRPREGAVVDLDRAALALDLVERRRQENSAPSDLEYDTEDERVDQLARWAEGTNDELNRSDQNAIELG